MKKVIALLLISMALVSLSGCTDTTSTATPTPSATPQPTANAYGAATAQAWYGIAEQAAKSWKQDANIKSITGGNLGDDGKIISYDGTSLMWTYTFYSLSSKLALDIYVKKGEITGRSEHALNTAGLSEDTLINSYTGLYAMSDCKVDSSRAAQIANALYKSKFGVEPEGYISFMLTNSKGILSGEKQFRWSVSYDPEVNASQVVINALNGDVVSS